MAQIRNRFDIQNQIDEENVAIRKKLPNFFLSMDEVSLIKGLSFSLLTHIIFAGLLIIITTISGIIFPQFKKPALPNRDVEFKLVQNESKPPINKNTKIRSDRDSQAGGKHDPKRAISEPSPQPAAKKAQPQKAAQKPVQKPQPKVQPKQQPQKVAQKPLQQIFPPKPQPTKTVAKAPSAPSPVKAPSAVKPAVKPSLAPSGVAKPTAPKIATAPKSPFNVAVPSSQAPVGSTYRPSGQPGASGGGGGAPAPKFSSSGGGSGAPGGSSGGKYAPRGTSGGGSGNGGNPGPGNPNGAPGIDALRQPNWGPYMKDLEQRIKRNWTPPKGDSSRRVVITFTIGRDGRLLSHKITKSSGVPLVDRAAMSAIELTAPFRPLPPEFKGQSVPIEFTFDYNVLNSVLR